MPALPINQLPPGQPNYGIVTYGPYTFGVFRNFRVQCTPVYDEADRVVTHLQYKLTCHGCILQNDSLPVQQINMGAMQDALTAPGQQLIVKDIGFDRQWDTNAPPTRDVIWGPKPRMLNMHPWGELAWEFDWEVEFNVSRCVSAGAFALDNWLMAWNYEVNFTVGGNGLVTAKTTSGYLQVIAARGVNPADANKVLFNVDNAWNQITFNIPYGFRRVNNTRTINKAKNRIDFSITEEELPGAAFPPGIAYCEARLDVASQPPGLAAWHATLRASYEVAPGFPKSLAIAKFLTLLNDRATKLKTAVVQGAAKKAALIPMRLAVSRELYDRTTEIAVTFFMPTTSEALLQSGGLWEPLPENDWQEWANSLKQAGVTSNKGFSQVGFDNTEDNLVTMCSAGSSPAAQIVLGAPPTDQHDSDSEADDNADEGEVADETGTGLYLLYQSTAREVKHENFIVHHYAQNYQPGDSNYQPNTTEYESAPDNYIVMEGRAVRVDQMPDPPAILTVGGQPVELVKKRFVADDKPTTLCFGHKLYAAQWEMWYRVKAEPYTSEPTGIPTIEPDGEEPLEVA